jgi:methyl-accepting chemotaxis protein
MAHTQVQPASEADGEKFRATGDARAPQSGSADPGRRIAELETELELYRDLVERVVRVTSDAANGNLEVRILHSGASGPLHTIAISVNHLLDMTDAFLREAGAALEYASKGKYFRRVLLRGMRGTFRHKSQLINQATETIAGDAGSLGEVERLISSSAQITQEAVREATAARGVVKELGQASERIGKVVQSISQVAWQTKLLAFNAKIEASRAGDAGRGFDVVAQEVKNLAQQTASATDDISREIKTIREEIERTSRAMETVSKTIGQVQEISANVERAVVEQKAAQRRGTNS